MRLTSKHRSSCVSPVRVGKAFLLLWVCAVAPARAQQEQLAVQVTTRAGLMEVRAKNQTDEVRQISVALNGQLLTEFKTDFGITLDFLATYAGIDATYIVLRTNQGQGACVGTDVFVLTLYEYGVRGEKKPPVDVSPVLRKCMGEAPPVKFEMDERGKEVISVIGYELRNGRWVQARKGRRR